MTPATIARADRDARALHGPAKPDATASAPSGPQYLDRVASHLRLREPELTQLSAHGFLVLDRAPVPFVIP